MSLLKCWTTPGIKNYLFVDEQNHFESEVAGGEEISKVDELYISNI